MDSAGCSGTTPVRIRHATYILKGVHSVLEDLQMLNELKIMARIYAERGHHDMAQQMVVLAKQIEDRLDRQDNNVIDFNEWSQLPQNTNEEDRYS
jgi:hypothetical protein